MDPEDVGKPSRGFRVVRLLARLMLRSQYRRIEVAGADRIPEHGALLLVSNHFSSLVDSMALFHACSRPVSFLAKAPLWRSGILRPFLNATEAVPVYRPADQRESERSVRANLATFEGCWERLREGGAIALFPEGVSQPQPRLMPLRTGAARIAIDAEVPLTICPAGLVYAPGAQRYRGTLLVTFGRPVEVHGWKGFPSRRAAIAEITRRIEAGIRDQLAEADSQDEMDKLRALRVIWDQERGASQPRTQAERHRRDRVFARGLARLRAASPEALDRLKAETDAYVRALDLTGIPPEHLRGRYSWRRMLRFFLLKGPVLLLGTPLALVAAIATWPARQLGDILALRTFGGTEDVRALCRMIGGGLILVILMGLGFLLGLVFGGLWVGLGILIGLPVLLAFHIFWQDHSQDIRAGARSFFLLAGAPLRRTLQAKRHDLYKRLLEVEAYLEEEPDSKTEVA